MNTNIKSIPLAFDDQKPLFPAVAIPNRVQSHSLKYQTGLQHCSSKAGSKMPVQSLAKLKLLQIQVRINVVDLLERQSKRSDHNLAQRAFTVHWQQHLPKKRSTYFYSWEAIRENTTCTLLIGSLLNRQLLFQLERGQYQRSIVTVRTKKQKNTEKKNHCTNSYYVLLTWSKSFSVYLRVIESQIWKNTNKYLVQRHFEFK